MLPPKIEPIKRKFVDNERYRENAKAKKLGAPDGCFDVGRYKCWLTGGLN